jgi:Protein of unknown function (DUF3072)
MTNPKTDIRSNTEKDPDDWVSGDEPMTGALSQNAFASKHTARQSFINI